MKPPLNLVSACLMGFLSLAGTTAGAADAALSWPPVTSETKPWTYWWWLGSAVDKTNLTRELERYHDAGLGGVHIIPIYGVKGGESNYIRYLSPQWMEMLRHTVTEAKRLGMGVDMTTGTGWCFGGGPNVGESEGNASVVVKIFEPAAGAKLAEKFDSKTTQALVAFSSSSRRRGNESQTNSELETPHVVSYDEVVDLTKKIGADGAVDWVAPGDGWRVYAVSQKLSGQKVKRASPGGEGPMLNLLYPDAMRTYLRGFDEAFASYDGPKPRAQYHDSYEYKSDWSPDFFAQFEKRRGYKLQAELPALFGTNQDDHVARVKSDYRETVSDLIGESLTQWVKWSHDHGFITRNEAHGSPGNLLDLYAVADIPETEVFRTNRNPLITKFASSAAHMTGKNLVSAETGTWLAEHFTETLADMKSLADEMFLGGVNHIFYHGTCYSPDKAAWPGWLFYASTQMNLRNSIWRDAPALNAYIARCQSMLQSGRPDNDILLYWPIHDLWHNPAGRLTPLQVEAQQKWFHSQPVGKAAKQLWERGYCFDYISDRQLAAAKYTDGKIKTAGGEYRVIVVPPCEHIPLDVFKKLSALAKSGAVVVFENHLPIDVPGWNDLEKRRTAFARLNQPLSGSSRRKEAQTKSKTSQSLLTSAATQMKRIKVGRGEIVVGDLESALAKTAARREPMVDEAGLFFIRRAVEGGRDYFIANHGTNAFDCWLPLTTAAKSVLAIDALSGVTGVAATRQSTANSTEVYLHLAVGESVILRTFSDKSVDGTPWPVWRGMFPGNAISGEWKLDFISGGPVLPTSFTTTNLASWTELGDTNAQSFAGTARYTITFDALQLESSLQVVPDTLKRGLQPFILDLGKVCQSARVKLNGKDYGTLITPPFRVVVDNLKPKDNVLEVEVTNVSANRIRDLDRRGVSWKIFNDINFVNINYKPFDASDWPLADSGLLGPVTLTAVTEFQPAP